MKHKFRLFCDGEHTYAELDGKSIGRGVPALKFEHDMSVAKGATLELKIDLSTFEFSKDGNFDEVVKEYAEHEPPKVKNLERLK